MRQALGVFASEFGMVSNGSRSLHLSCLVPAVLPLRAGLVVYGGSAAADEGHQLGWTDGVGIGIGAVSMLGMAVFYVYVQKTEGVIAEEHVLYVEYATMCLTLPALSYWLESGDWGGLLRYGWLDWGNLLFASLGVRLFLGAHIP